jgi:hypothetical protein
MVPHMFGSPLQGRVVGLRALGQNDVERLRSFELGDGSAAEWRFGGSRPGPRSYFDFLWSDVLAIYGVHLRGAQQELIGYVSAYNPRLNSGTANIAVNIHQRWRKRGIGIFAVILFVEFLFSRWPLEQVRFEVLQSNMLQFGAFIDSIGEIEATLSGHSLVTGEPEDLVVVACTREAWCDAVSPFISSL